MTPLLFPAIDLLGGRAVRLHKGERRSARVYSEDPPAQARAFVEQGARYLHVVDLDAAFGEKRQTALIERIAQALTTDSTAPSSTSLALARAFNVELAPSSTAVPATAPETTGASLVPVTVTVTLLLDAAPNSSCMV